MSPSPGPAAAPAAIETHTIDFIPHEERRGKPWHQFTLWFGANSVIVSVVTASIIVGPTMGLGWSVVAIIVGFALGSFFSAFHAAQGPKLGIPQMVQSRAQFGYVGGILPMIIALINYLVFFAASPAICGQLALALWGWDPFIVTIAVTLITFVVALYGYDLAHRLAKYLSVAAVVVFGVFTILMLRPDGIPGAVPVADAGFDLALFFTGIAITFVYSAGYAPYIADYSRYLPSDSSVAATAWWTYAGIAASSIWLFLIGAYLFAATGYEPDVIGSVLGVTDAFSPIFTGLFVIVVIAIQVLQGSLSMYAGGNTLISVATSLRRERTEVNPSLRVRLLGLVPFAIVCAVVAIIYTMAFTEVFSYALGIVLLLLIPWSAINLTDFYILRRGRYDVAAIFDPRGEYGVVNWAGILSFVIGFLVQLPFANLLFYVGPVAQAAGADFAWIPGIVVSAVAYIVLTRLMRRPVTA